MNPLLAASVLLGIVLSAFALVGCSGQITGVQTQINSQIVDPLITDLSKIGNTAKLDLQNVIVVGNAATPPDTDGVACATAALAVQANIAKVMTAANTPAAGVLTMGELASLFQPGSQQYNAAKQTLTSGCAAKAQDVLGAAGVLAAGGAVGALAASSGILPLAAAVP